MIYKPEPPYCMRCGEVHDGPMYKKCSLEWHGGWVCCRCLRPEDNPPITQEELDKETDRQIAEFERRFRRKPDQEKSDEAA